MAGVLAAEFRAMPADRGDVGVAELVAGLGAGFADFRARAAGNPVQVRVTEHEVFRGVGDRRAVEQVPDVVRVGVFAALFQAIVNGVDAGVMRVFACMDALVMFVVLVFVDVGHGFVLVCCFLKRKAVFACRWRGFTL